MMKDLRLFYIPSLLLSLSLSLSACGSYGAPQSYSQELMSDAKSTFTMHADEGDTAAVFEQRLPLVKPTEARKDYLPLPGSAPLYKNSVTVAAPYAPSQNLAVPPESYAIPASTAPIGKKGMDEARKELLRQKNPNLTPSKKPWWSKEQQ